MSRPLAANQAEPALRGSAHPAARAAAAGADDAAPAAPPVAPALLAPPLPAPVAARPGQSDGVDGTASAAQHPGSTPAGREPRRCSQDDGEHSATGGHTVASARRSRPIGTP